MKKTGKMPGEHMEEEETPLEAEYGAKTVFLI